MFRPAICVCILLACQHCLPHFIYLQLVFLLTHKIWIYQRTGLKHRDSTRIKSIHGTAAAAAKSLQSCSTLCDPIDGSPPGSPVPGILQGRTLEWVAISFSNAWKWKVKVKSLSCVQLFGTPWTAAYQAPPSMGFSRQEYSRDILIILSLLEVHCMFSLHFISKHQE